MLGILHALRSVPLCLLPFRPDDPGGQLAPDGMIEQETRVSKALKRCLTDEPVLAQCTE